jgi:hypothetical protein
MESRQCREVPDSCCEPQRRGCESIGVPTAAGQRRNPIPADLHGADREFDRIVRIATAVMDEPLGRGADVNVVFLATCGVDRWSAQAVRGHNAARLPRMKASDDREP